MTAAISATRARYDNDDDDKSDDDELFTCTGGAERTEWMRWISEYSASANEVKTEIEIEPVDKTKTNNN